MFLWQSSEEQLDITLWESLASQFDENAVKSLDDPVIIVFASMMIKQYMGKYQCL